MATHQQREGLACFYGRLGAHPEAVHRALGIRGQQFRDCVYPITINANLGVTAGLQVKEHVKEADVYDAPCIQSVRVDGKVHRAAKVAKLLLV